jgi:hypothetical protein
LGEALGLLSQISAEDANIEPLREGWQQVVAGLAIVDRTAAVTLLNGESWAEFLRLGIAESVDSPEEFVSKYIKSPTGKQPLKKKRI